MFLQWIVLLLPSIHVIVAEVTCCIIWIRGAWLVVKAGLCQLCRPLGSQNVLFLDRQHHTCEGDGCLCGHFNVFPFLLSELPFFFAGTVLLKDARRAA